MRLATDRLLLRLLREADRDRNAEIFADPDVRHFSAGVLTSPQADARFDHAMAQYAARGWGILAVETLAERRFIGLIGLASFNETTRAAIPSHLTIQIVWQLDREVWGRGLAPEGARAVLGFAWNQLQVREVVAITAATNGPSRRVMEKIGMNYDPLDDFANPELPDGHWLRPHVLYRIANPASR